jgi:hypothetical protein
MVPDPAVDRTHGGQIVVLNPGTVPVEFSVDGQPSVKLAAAGRAAQTVTSPAPQVMTVHATGPVVVEFDVFGPAGTGVASLSLAVPAGS